MVRPGSWNRRNRLMNRQGTVWNHPEPEPKPKTFQSGSIWNQNWVEPERNRLNLDRGHHYLYPTSSIFFCSFHLLLAQFSKQMSSINISNTHHKTL